MNGGGRGNRTRVRRPSVLYLHCVGAQATLNRLAFGGANALCTHGIAAVATLARWMRTELVLHAIKADEGEGGRSRRCAAPNRRRRRARS
ncbi:MAG: hypothetical protein ACR2MC_07145 [Actinomycetota bacterium]